MITGSGCGEESINFSIFMHRMSQGLGLISACTFMASVVPTHNPPLYRVTLLDPLVLYSRKALLKLNPLSTINHSPLLRGVKRIVLPFGDNNRLCRAFFSLAPNLTQRSTFRSTSPRYTDLIPHLFHAVNSFLWWTKWKSHHGESKHVEKHMLDHNNMEHSEFTHSLVRVLRIEFDNVATCHMLMIFYFFLLVADLVMGETLFFVMLRCCSSARVAYWRQVYCSWRCRWPLGLYLTVCTGLPLYSSLFSCWRKGSACSWVS